METNEESVMEDIGYRKNIPESRSQQIQKLREIKKQLDCSRQKLPAVRILLRMNSQIYRYKFEIAKQLIKEGKATLIEVCE